MPRRRAKSSRDTLVSVSCAERQGLLHPLSIGQEDDEREAKEQRRDEVPRKHRQGQTTGEAQPIPGQVNPKAVRMQRGMSGTVLRKCVGKVVVCGYSYRDRLGSVRLLMLGNVRQGPTWASDCKPSPIKRPGITNIVASRA